MSWMKCASFFFLRVGPYLSLPLLLPHKILVYTHRCLRVSGHINRMRRNFRNMLKYRRVGSPWLTSKCYIKEFSQGEASRLANSQYLVGSSYECLGSCSIIFELSSRNIYSALSKLPLTTLELEEVHRNDNCYFPRPHLTLRILKFMTIKC